MGWIKKFCTYSLERQSQCHLMHPFSATALTSKFSLFFFFLLLFLSLSFFFFFLVCFFKLLFYLLSTVGKNWLLITWNGTTKPWIKLEALPAGTNPRTPHHWSPGGERRGKRKRQTIFLEKTREGHRQLDENWNRFKGNVGETFER